MDILIKTAQFFICFTLLVGIHEFGHYITARIFGMRVDKFYILFDPWFSIFKFKRGDTEYGLGWLPLGGYCKISGMIDESMDKEQLAQPPQPYEFRSKPAWQRFIVMVAGVALNLVLAIFIYIGVCWMWGEKYIPMESIKWGYVFNEQAKEIGFKDGDMILAIDAEPINEVGEITSKLILSEGDRDVTILRSGEQATIKVAMEELVELRRSKSFGNFVQPLMPFIIDSITYPTAKALRRGDQIIAINKEPMIMFSECRDALQGLRDTDVTLTALRNGEEIDITVPVDSEAHIGVLIENPYRVESRHYNLFESIPAGFKLAGKTISSYWGQLSMIAQPKTEMYKELGGFVAIGNMFSTEWNWEDFWYKTAFLSIILAVMNILPIPGLDGGHALFTLFEMVTGRKPSDKFLEYAQYVGMILLITLLLYANGNDLYRMIFR